MEQASKQAECDLVFCVGVETLGAGKALLSAMAATGMMRRS